MSSEFLEIGNNVVVVRNKYVVIYLEIMLDETSIDFIKLFTVLSNSIINNRLKYLEMHNNYCVNYM